ncbi:MAG: PQQ-dependent sugar dehydrogenase [Acidimicrobiia bacterium]
MTRRGRRCTIAALVASALLATSFLATTTPSVAAASIPKLKLTTVVDLTGLTAFASRADDSTLYVAEQVGRVRAVRNGTLVTAPVLDVTDDVTAGGEQGLLGLAFSPDGAKLYVNYTNRDDDTRVVEYEMTGNVADPNTRRVVLGVKQPQVNHNGGQLAFGADGDLYIGLGDGGAANDSGPGHAPGGNGQSLATLLGKILRIDPTPTETSAYTVPANNPFVGVAGALPEIWSYGLRNPWRFSFDAKTADLWIGDVGQNEVEEIDFAPATNGRYAGKGDNFGWNRLEGNDAFRGEAPDDVVAPIATHTHEEGWLSVIGGYVYRGTRIKALRGVYLYSDYYNGDIVGLRPSGKGSGKGKFAAVDLGLAGRQIAAFGQGPDLELYVLSQADGLQKIVKQ